MNPRIAIDARTVLQRKTGDRTYTLGLLRGLARVPSRYEFDVLLDAPDEAGLIAATTENSPRFAIQVLPARNSRTWSALALPRWAWQNRPALVHVQYLAPGPLPCPFVTTIHDVVWRALPHTFPGERSRDYEFGDAAFGLARRAHSDRKSLQQKRDCAHAARQSRQNFGDDDRPR